MAATGATELLLRFCDRLSPLLPYFEFLPRSVHLSSPPALPPSTLPRYPILHSPTAASLDFIPAPQRESIVKRQRRLPAKVVSDRHRVCLGYVLSTCCKLANAEKIYCVLQRNACRVVTGPVVWKSRYYRFLLRLNI